MSDPPEYSPLSPAAFQILVALAASPRHGYAIMKDVAAVTSGDVRLNPGTLYTTIRKLLEEGLIREAATPVSGADHDERRRYYAITPAGGRAARAELARLRALIDRASVKLAGKTAG
ncbi:MAG: PadR family transcriptional regulator [Bryobacteraceae bacterium]